MANRPTIFQNLSNLFLGQNTISPEYQKLPPTMSSEAGSHILYRTHNRDDYERKLQQFKQQKYLSYQWQKANFDATRENLNSYTAIRLMYRDADLMCSMPEIDSALDILSEESCSMTSEGKMLNIYSSSKRIKSILEELFINRLNIHVMLPMITHNMVKYGNEFMLLNIDANNGVMGWRELPVYEIDRLEAGYANTGYMISSNPEDLKPFKTQFVWQGHNNGNPFPGWTVAHFRLLKDSFFLPFGTSHLHKARRSWRMWSMMEDAMLIHRLDKSIERRVFKVYVGAIDESDVPAFIQEFANNFKRTPIIDPETGQVDLRKNFLDVSSDYFIPVRDPSAPTPIETLPAADYKTSMDDIQYMQNKVFSMLRVPKTFLNFQEAQGKGQNLSLLDIRMSRMINTIQQFLLMELNKIAMVHLSLLGFTDDVDNFTLSMNNPSAQIEALELEDITKRIQTAVAAVADPGTGIPLVSMHYALRKIMKLSDAEIKDILNEIRLEKAMAAELESTAQIIKKTGIFDSVDNIYGDYEVLNSPDGGAPQPQGEGEEGGMGGPGGGGADGFDGGSLSMDSLGSDAGGMGGGMESGEEVGADMSQAPDLDSGTPTNESNRHNKPILRETNGKIKSFTKQYFDMLTEAINKEYNPFENEYEMKNARIEDQISSILEDLDKIAQTDIDILKEDVEFTKNEVSGVTESDIDGEIFNAE